jgi:hypothetical protein
VARSPLLGFHPFSRQKLWELIRAASFYPREEIPVQANYLASYLSHEDAGAKTIVAEAPYVDRHYLEEYTGYYSTVLHPPPTKTTRLHVFAHAFTESDFRQSFIAQDMAFVERLQDSYLGFIVVRPLPSAPIGRTILRPYRGAEEREYGPRFAPNRVHLAGLELLLDGVPFQQQDQGVGACATTAVWSALARVMRADGLRTCTPLAVTEAATRHVLSGRAFPAVGGHELAQSLSAVREFGYAPHVLKPGKEHDIFLLALKCYVASGIPVILRIADPRIKSADGHALTVVGYREDRDSDRTIRVRITESHVVTSAPFSRIYVHDDRLGPYARMVLGSEGSDVSIKVWPYEKGFEPFEALANVWHAIVPLYPKIRLTAEDMVGIAGSLLPLVKSCVPTERRDALRVDLRFALAGRYLRHLASRQMDRDRLYQFISNASFSRYIGIIRFSVSNEWLADVVVDTTDIRRYDDIPSVLAAVPRREEDTATFSAASADWLVA